LNVSRDDLFPTCQVRHLPRATPSWQLCLPQPRLGRPRKGRPFF
jgi:hypothetical protein